MVSTATHPFVEEHLTAGAIDRRTDFVFWSGEPVRLSTRTRG
jgi:hypothetical protein